MAKIKREVNSSSGIDKSKSHKMTSLPSKIKKPKNLLKKGKPGRDILSKDSCVINDKIAKKMKQKKQKSVQAIELKNKFNIKAEDVENAIKGVIKFREENPKLQNQLFEESAPLFLQISCHKIPRGNSKILRIPLKHSLYSSEDEVCLIVSEVKQIKNIEHEKHIEHYEKLLQDKGVNNIKKIMTFHEFRTEHETYEQKNRLVDLYDVFLADSKISGKLVKKCGKIFLKKRKLPASIKLQATKLKEHIDKTLLKTFLNIHLKGNSYSVQIGHSNMQVKQLTENLEQVLEFLDKVFPGGFTNIRGLQVSAPRASSIPIYFSSSTSDLVVPKLNAKKPRAFITYRGELSTLPNAEVTVKPYGEVIVNRIPQEDDIVKITDEDIIQGNKEKAENSEESGRIIKKKIRKTKNSKQNINNEIIQKTDKKKTSKVKKNKGLEKVQQTNKRKSSEKDSDRGEDKIKAPKNKKRNLEVSGTDQQDKSIPKKKSKKKL